MGTLSFVAIAGAIAAFWQHIRALFTNLRSIIIKKAVFERDSANPALVFFSKKSRKLFASCRFFGGKSQYIRSKLDNQLVIFEKTLPNGMPSIVLYKKAIIFVSPSFDAVSIFYLRGTLDIEALNLEISEFFAKFAEGSEGERFFVKQVYSGCGYIGKSDDTEAKMGSDSSPNDYDITTCRCITHDIADISDSSDTKSEKNIVKSSYVDRVFESVERFIKNKEWYNQRGIPWKTGFLFHGKAGNGKTSVAVALAKKFDIPIFAVNLSGMNNYDFINHFNNMKSWAPAIVLFEDFDQSFNGRENIHSKENMTRDHVTFDSFLNSLDGVRDSEGLIIIVSTNNYDAIDLALKRHGRLGNEVEFVGPTLEEKKELARKISGKDDFVDDTEVSWADFEKICIDQALSEFK